MNRLLVTMSIMELAMIFRRRHVVRTRAKTTFQVLIPVESGVPLLLRTDDGRTHSNDFLSGDEHTIKHQEDLELVLFQVKFASSVSRSLLDAQVYHSLTSSSRPGGIFTTLIVSSLSSFLLKSTSFRCIASEGSRIVGSLTPRDALLTVTHPSS